MVGLSTAAALQTGGQGCNKTACVGLAVAQLYIHIFHAGAYIRQISHTAADGTSAAAIMGQASCAAGSSSSERQAGSPVDQSLTH